MNKSLILILSFLLQYYHVRAQDLKLSPPQASIIKGIIKEIGIPLTFDFRMDNADIHYTTDGTIPNLNSKKYNDTLFIKKPCTIIAKAFHPSFLPSEAVNCTFINAGKEFSSVTINQANPSYKAEGSWTINNKKLGSSNYNKDYLGYEGEPIILDIAFDKKEKTKEVLISFLINQKDWIFSPSTIIIQDDKGKLIQHLNILESNKEQETKYVFIRIPCKGKYKSLRIIIDPIDVIPTWHPGKGGKPWLFIDEVLVY